MRITNRAIWAVLFAAGVLTGLAAAPAKKAAKQFLNVGDHKPPGYTEVVTTRPGKTIYISGRGGTAADGTMPADFSTQARNTFEDMKRCLALGGATFKDVVKINYFIKDPANVAELRRIRAEYLDMEHPPAATLVQAGLMGSMQLEVEAIAVIPD